MEKKKIQRHTQTAHICRSGWGRKMTINYVKSKKNKYDVKLLHNCSYSSLLASSKSDVRKETCEEKKAQIIINIFINLFSNASQMLITQTRSYPSQGMICTKLLFITSQFRADSWGHLCHSAFLHLQCQVLSMPKLRQNQLQSSLLKRQDTKTDFLPCICHS